MVSRPQRRITLRRKLSILRTISCSKSVKRSSIILDALFHIYELKLKVEAIKREISCLNAIKREYLNLMKQFQLPKKEVKVVKAGKGFLVRAICKKGGDQLVSVLETFEQMGLIVMHTRVSCKFYFAMEAIVVADQEEHAPDVNRITQAVLQAIDREGEESRDRQ